jgi:hypothetical protein
MKVGVVEKKGRSKRISKSMKESVRVQIAIVKYKVNYEHIICSTMI